MITPAIMLMALGVEALFGWPKAVHARIGHPVMWIGALIDAGEKAWNRAAGPPAARYGLGAVLTLFIVGVSAAAAWEFDRLTPGRPWGWALDALAASSLFAAKSLHQAVGAVFERLSADDPDGARTAVGHLVGRDTTTMQAPAIARAALESLAENASDGVVAPFLWGALFGLPGLAAYKAVNTLDSMIGHRSARHHAFGGFAARLDDAANLIPARLTALAFLAVARRLDRAAALREEARRHRSPNAGWPEAAMAFALDRRLSGPRAYGGVVSEEPFIHAAGSDPTPADGARALKLYRRGLALACTALALLSAGLYGMFWGSGG